MNKIANRICRFAICLSVCHNNISANTNAFDDTSDIDQVDYSNISANLTRCSSTQLSLGKEVLLHTWEVKGLLNYLIYLRRFDQIFELKTEEISFKSENVDGKWYFKISKTKVNSRTEMKIGATYSYEARQQKKISFGINLSLVHDNREIVLPLQKSLNAVMIQQRYFNTRGYSSTLEYAYTFSWPDTQQAFDNILRSRSNNSNGDIHLRFFIVAYFPTEPKYSGSETCHEIEMPDVEGSAGGVTSQQTLLPPYLRHSNSMLHDDRYTDMIIKFGQEEIPAHRIILATSSPVFSDLINNLTILQAQNETSKENSEPIQLIIDNKIDAIGFEEMLRYVYTGKVLSLEQVAEQTIVAAEIYGLAELKKISEAVLISTIKPENSIQMYTLGKDINSSKLTRKAFAIMKANKNKIVNQSDEFRQLTANYPNLMFELFVS